MEHGDLRSKKRVLRTHTKSRRGCSSCKKRRCDESHPICGSCKRRDIECVWPESFASSRPQEPTQAEAYQWLVPSPSASSLNASLPLNTSALRLMHHYSLITSTTLNIDPSALFTYQFVVPAIAFREGAVMHALLALSAIHLHALYQPLDIADQDYLGLARQHKNQALLLTHVLDANPSSSDTHLLARNFLVVYKMAESLAIDSDSPLVILSLIETMGYVLRDKVYFYRDEQLEPLNWPFLGHAPAPTEEQEEESPSSLDLRIFPRFLKHLHLPNSPYSNPDPEEVRDLEISAVYQESVNRLRYSWYTSQRAETGFGAATWVITMSDRFREFLVVERRPRALVLLYFYCVLLGRMESTQFWWAGKHEKCLAWIGMMLDNKWMECILETNTT
ncbi:hypothetical protein VNI00_008538 [Paramarasmius palmivorus]|uniref:Zn(2)-C6 fungal-type domain-containing protein n=1 Tax=Paramarasmius palmivorus TaxID=297713 RepID=A0AAW0CY57_9AGAR